MMRSGKYLTSVFYIYFFCSPHKKQNGDHHHDQRNEARRFTERTFFCQGMDFFLPPQLHRRAVFMLFPPWRFFFYGIAVEGAELPPALPTLLQKGLAQEPHVTYAVRCRSSQPAACELHQRLQRRCPLAQIRISYPPRGYMTAEYSPLRQAVM